MIICPLQLILVYLLLVALIHNVEKLIMLLFALVCLHTMEVPLIVALNVPSILTVL